MKNFYQLLVEEVLIAADVYRCFINPRNVIERTALIILMIENLFGKIFHAFNDLVMMPC